jgi:deoxyribodipyrimidine photo-lyase
MKTSILWFTTDLRLTDNQTLKQAIENSDQVLPVYCFDETYFGNTKYGTLKTSGFRTQFLLESLQDLRQQLKQLGSNLHVVKGKPEIELLKLAQQYNAQQIFTQQQYATEELNTQQKVKTALTTINTSLICVETATLYLQQDLGFTIEKLPNIFTEFRKHVETKSKIRGAIVAPLKINSPLISDAAMPSLAELNIEKTSIDCKAVLQFKGGEAEAKKRLNHYFFETQALSQYKQTRNGMIGSNYSSKFSAWLALGCISVVSIYQSIKQYEQQYGANESTYWLYFELMWRDYFYFVMQKFGNHLFLKKGIKAKVINTKHNQALFNKWASGNTGVDFIDANMKELNQTGFMSNRGRQNVASYFCNDLNLDWRFGAAYFEQQLIDYDVCSNWGNWAYIAGVGNDPRPNRHFNISKQANDYDSNGEYRKLWLSN